MLVLVCFISQFVLAWQVECSAEYEVLSDQFENTYLFDSNEIQKLDKEGQHLYTYSNLRNGEITNIDISNPLRLAVYFGDNNEVIFLDNTLSPQGDPLNLNSLGLYDVSLVCSSFDNHLWVWRSAEQKLVRISKNSDVVNESINLQRWLPKSGRVSFDQLQESGDKLFLSTESGLILVFDQYGSYLYTRDLVFDNELKFANGNVIFSQDNVIYQFIPELRLRSELYSIEMKETEDVLKSFRVNRYAVFSDGELSLYRVSETQK